MSPETQLIIINRHHSSSVTLFSKKLTTKDVDDRQSLESKMFIKCMIRPSYDIWRRQKNKSNQAFW